MADVTLRIVDGTDLTTSLGVLDQPYGIEWTAERGDAGAGAFTIPHDSPALVADADLLERDNLVVVRVDDVDTFGWLIRRRGRVRGDVWDPVTVTGPGMLELLRHALVYPIDGLDAAIVSDDRLFGWMSRDFDDGGGGGLGGWATVQGSEIGAPISTGGFSDATVGFHAYLAGARSLYRRLIPAAPDDAGPARMQLAALASAEVVVYVDGEEVLRHEEGQRGVVAVDLDYPPGDVQLAVEASGPGSNRWGWEWRTLNVADDDDETTTVGGVLRRTYDPVDFPASTPWLVYSGDIPYPGVTPGFILGTLFDEAQARGYLGALTKGFDADVDSHGNAWPRVGEWGNAPGTVELAVKVGDDNVLSVAERLGDLGVDVVLGPDLVFHAYQGRGIDRTATVTIAVGAVRELASETEDETINTVLARTQRAWVERPSPSPTSGRREGFLALGMVPSDEGGASIADDVLATFNDPRQVASFALSSVQTALPAPTVDYHVGDRVLGPWIAGGAWVEAAVRVDTLAATVDETGEVDWVHEVSAP